MVKIFHAEFDMVGRYRSIIEIRSIAPVANARTVLRVVLVYIRYTAASGFMIIAVQNHPVTVESNCCVAEQFVTKHIIPASGYNRISPVQTVFIFIDAIISVLVFSGILVVFINIEMIVILSMIEAEENTTAVIEFMVYLGVKVIKVVVVAFVVSFEDAGKKGCMGAACTD